MGLWVVMVAQDGLKQVKASDKDNRYEHEGYKDEEAGDDLDLRYGKSPQREQNAPGVDEQRSLPLVKPLLYETMLDVPLVRPRYARMSAAAADDGSQGVDNGHAGNDKRHDEGSERCRAGDAEQRDDAQNEPEGEGTGIAHEDACGIEVVAQEPDTASCEGDGERGGVEPARHKGEDEEGERRYGGNARGQPVEAVDEVDDVGKGDQVDDGYGVGEPPQGDLTEPGVHDVPDQQPRSGGDRGRHHLTKELLARSQGPDVVGDAREKDHEDREG